MITAFYNHISNLNNLKVKSNQAAAVLLVWPQVHWPRISYRSMVISFFSMRPSTSSLRSWGNTRIRVLEANLYLALFL